MSLTTALEKAQQRYDQCYEALQAAERELAEASAAVELERRKAEIRKAAQAGQIVAVPAANCAALERPVMRTVKVAVFFTLTPDKTSVCITDCEIDRLFWVFQDEYNGVCLFMEPYDPIGLSENDLDVLRNEWLLTGRAQSAITFCIS